jgi:hypothetical protein
MVEQGFRSRGGTGSWPAGHGSFTMDHGQAFLPKVGHLSLIGQFAGETAFASRPVAEVSQNLRNALVGARDERLAPV